MISIIENILALPEGKRKYVMDKKYGIAKDERGQLFFPKKTFFSNLFDNEFNLVCSV